MLIELGGPRAQPPAAQASPFALGGALPGSSLARPSASAIDALSTEDRSHEEGEGSDNHSGSSNGAQDSPVGRLGTTHRHTVPTTTPESAGSSSHRSNGRYAVGKHSSSPAAAHAPLHSGGLLGTLPGLSVHKSPVNSLNEDEEKGGEGSSNGPGDSNSSHGKKASPYRHSSSSSGSGGRSATGRMSAGNANPSARAAAAAAVPAGFPRHLICGICERPLQDPVRLHGKIPSEIRPFSGGGDIIGVVCIASWHIMHGVSRVQLCVCACLAGAVALRRLVRAARGAHLAPAQRLHLSVDWPTAGGGRAPGRSGHRARGERNMQGTWVGLE